MLDRMYLSIVTVGFVAALIALPGLFSTRTTPLMAYAVTLGVYWSGCWIMILLCRPGVRTVVWPRADVRSLRWLIWLPVLGVLGVTAMKADSIPPPEIIALLVALACVNGLTEEFFWRRLFAEVFADDLVRGLSLPWIFFTLWHIALLRIPNVHYQGGATALVGGAAMMGALWGMSYWFNRNLVGICAAHMIANFFAFWMLAIDNGWIPVA